MHKWLGLIGQEAVARVVRVSSIGGGGELGELPPFVLCVAIGYPGNPRIYRRTMALSQCTR